MKQISIIILTLFIINSCKQNNKKDIKIDSEKIEYQQILNTEYILEKPSNKINAVLFLFGGFPEVAEDVKREFKVLEQAKENEIAVVYSNFNQKLWFEKDELKTLAEQIKGIFNDNKLPNDNIYFGGFSSGGNVALLLGDYLTKNEKLGLKPKGLFIVDSPIDLSALYFSSEKNLKRNFSNPAIQESKWLIKTLGGRFGNPKDILSGYEKFSVFTSKTENINNVSNLKNTKIRMYTEPDTIWWKENRKADYEQMNAYYIKKLSEKLKQQDFSKVEYIPTKDKGYRANGERHPHSWSIVETTELIKWILNEK